MLPARMVLRSARRPAAPMRLLARPLTSTPRALLPHVPSKREEECRRPASPFLLPSAGLHTTPPLEHGYVNKKFPNRPISPHVMIYAFPVVAISSITMRISGVMLSVGCAGIAGMACVDPAMPSELMSYLSTHSLLAIPTKAAVSFTLIYHFIVACRHTWWDKTAAGLKNQDVLQSSYAVAGASLALTGVMSAM